MARDFAKAFYSSPQWEKVRNYVLIRDKYKCCLCGNSGSLEVHHIKHLTPDNINDASVTLNDKNLLTLCRDCHFKQHKTERIDAHFEKKKKDCDPEYYFDENGLLCVRENVDNKKRPGRGVKKYDVSGADR